jgi:hypothetical protein
VRCDIGVATHAFCADCREANIRFSVGYAQDETVREAILELPEDACVQEIDADGADRDGAWVAELTEHLDLSAWPAATRLIVRRERPHPDAQFTIFDQHGCRHTCFLTDQAGNDIVALELRHRRRARVEDRIREGKDTGMRNLPHRTCTHNQTWLELSLIVQDLLTWTKLTLLDGALAKAEPSGCVTGCCTSPAGSCATAAGATSDSRPTGPGRTLSLTHSTDCARSPRSPE